MNSTTDIEYPLNDKLFEFTEERGDYQFPHYKETTSSLFRLNSLSSLDRAIATQELTQLILNDPGFAYNFARFAKEQGKPLDSTVLDKEKLRRPSIADMINAFDPFFVIPMMSATEEHSQVFQDHPKVGTLFRKIAAETSRHAKRTLGEVPTDQSMLAVYMVFNSALPILSIASMAPAIALRILLAGDHIEEVAEDLLGFKIAEIVPFLEEKHAMPRTNNPAYPVATRTAATRSQQELRTFLRHPQSKVA